MSILNKIMSKRRKPEITFGLHDNCVIVSLDNNEKTNNKGEVMNLNTTIKFGLLDKKGENVIKEKDISWWNIDTTNENAYKDFENQLYQLTNIADTILGVDEDNLNRWDKKFNAICEDFEIETAAEIKEIIEDPKECKSFVKKMSDSFVELLSSKVGLESKRIRFKLVYDYKGQNLRQPKYTHFVESMEVSAEKSKIKLDNSDLSSLEKNKKQNKGSSNLDVASI